jgi:hypothetical protein
VAEASSASALPVQRLAAVNPAAKLYPVAGLRKPYLAAAGTAVAPPRV